jgi:DNA-binding SARP family transcriptional activator/TolB-like protein
VIRINALGGLSIVGADGKPVAGAAAQPRRMAMLAILARAGQRGVTREKLMALLWPDDERGPRTLAQALYSLRRDLGGDEAITGTNELHLESSFITSDVAEFAAALARGEDERAVSLYHGPFLDGFRVSGLEEFARWAERERSSMAADHSRALESLARSARVAGDLRAAIARWRKLAALEPLNARVTVGLMDALAAAGDRAGALQHARIYEALVEQELELPPDREVLAFADRLRREASESPSQAPNASIASPLAAAVAPVASPVEGRDDGLPSLTPSVEERPIRPRASVVRRLVASALAVMAIVAVALVISRPWSTATPRNGEILSVIAIGNIAAFDGDSAQTSLTAQVADLLTTSLARVRSIRVVSHGRMLELIRLSGDDRDTTAGRFVDAARSAGATEIIDGTLYSRPGGRLRLDLRRVDLATGDIGDVHTVEGSDLFTLVDSGTTRLVAAMGVAAPHGSVADVTTRSMTAYRMYEEGIRTYYLGDYRSAYRFFEGALSEDSLFALAAYYAGMSSGDAAIATRRLELARRLAAHTSDRERLMIQAGWAYAASSPSLRAIADTLATRYPDDVEGHLYSGISRVFDGEFLDGLDPLQRTVRMDSAGLAGTRPRCAGCEALRWIVSAYILADSLPAAERAARRWVRLQPTSGLPTSALAFVLQIADRESTADSLIEAGASREWTAEETVDTRVMQLIRVGKYDAAERILQAELDGSDPGRRTNANWHLAISLREQGRLTRALDAARGSRRRIESSGVTPGPPMTNALEALVLLEMGRASSAAALFDSLARQRIDAAPSAIARNRLWSLTHVAGARFAAGDTVTLARLADSIQALGEQSGYGRDRRLHHYVRGLLFSARRDNASAIRELRAAVYSLSAGYTRINYELARVYLRENRARDAVTILQPALRGALDASNLYVNRSDLHELLAEAWDAAGQRDSAAFHYAWVSRAWSEADDAFKPRVTAARARFAALSR